MHQDSAHAQADGHAPTGGAADLIWRWLSSATGGTLVGALLAAGVLGAVWHERTSAPEIILPPPSSDMNLSTEGVDALGALNRIGLRLQLFLLSPQELGVPGWELGDTSSYNYRYLNPEDCPPRGCPCAPTVEVAVVGRSRDDHAVVERRDVRSDLYWLHWNGLEVFRRIPEQHFTLAEPSDLRSSPRMPRYRYMSGYFPSIDEFADLSQVAQASLSFVDFSTEEVPAGTFECMHFQARMGEETLDVWTSPEVTPLGIVRVRSSKEELELVSTGNDPARVEIESPMDLLVDGVSTLAYGCMSCHLIHDCHEPVIPPR